MAFGIPAIRRQKNKKFLPGKNNGANDAENQQTGAGGASRLEISRSIWSPWVEVTMDFLVEFEICVPPGQPEFAADLSKRERARAAEIMASSRHFFKMAWIVPCQPNRVLLCSAADAAELHETMSSLPAMPWLDVEATPLIECGAGSSICIPD